MNAERPAAPLDVFLDEYSQDGNIAKYLSDTAGAGIAYALTHVYAPMYRKVISALIDRRPKAHTFRVLEYGCGGGMNLLKLIELFHQQRRDVDVAVGTDFSPRMIDAARQEAARHLPSTLHQKIRFVVASNETLAQEVVAGLGARPEDVLASFDLVVGVNTFRYCHRLKREDDCARDIFRLLRPGGYSIMIDMNQRFPLFRSRVSSMLRHRDETEVYIPSLAEYARPFEHAGFAVQERRNFCWIPHSARPSLVTLCRVMAPILDRSVPAFAMRSLVIGQKPT